MKRLIAIVLMLLAIDPVSSQELDLTNAMSSGPLIQNSSFENCQIFQGGATCGEWNNTGLGDWGKYETSSKEFLFSYDVTRLWQDIDITNLNTNQFAYYLYFDLNASCKNSIGGYCENPEGPADFFSARLNFYSGDTLFKQDILLDGATYTQDWTPFLFSGQIDSANQITMIQVEFYGQDVGYWAGFYGPRLDNAQLSLLYNEIQIAVDCQLSPYDPTCIIQDLTTFTDEELSAMSDVGHDSSEPMVEEPEQTLIADETLTEPDLEQTLTDEATLSTTETPVAETIEKEITYRELTDEEKAAILADSIAKSVLESALSIDADSTKDRDSGTTLADSTTVTRSTVNLGSDSILEQEIAAIEIKLEDVRSDDADNSASADIFETGRQMGRDALAQTQAASEQSSMDSMSTNNAAENAMGNMDNSGATNSMMAREDSAEQLTDNETTTVIMTEPAAAEDINTMNTVAADTQSMQQIDSWQEIMQIELGFRDPAVDDAMAIIQAVSAAQEQADISAQQDSLDAEQTTIANDPALAAAFNVAPNITNLEAAGALTASQREPSDAERRAEEVVAANAREQEEINNNYMEADQGGIVAAMGADTDVNSYRSAMLNDNNTWYRPEDIYKNVVYKDNVRGAYYLEKGNSDTYRRMVDEQYK